MPSLNHHHFQSNNIVFACPPACAHNTVFQFPYMHPNVPAGTPPLSPSDASEHCNGSLLRNCFSIKFILAGRITTCADSKILESMDTHTSPQITGTRQITFAFRSRTSSLPSSRHLRAPAPVQTLFPPRIFPDDRMWRPILNELFAWRVHAAFACKQCLIGVIHLTRGHSLDSSPGVPGGL